MIVEIYAYTHVYIYKMFAYNKPFDEKLNKDEL